MWRYDDQEVRYRIKREREVRGARSSDWGAILLVATEERVKRLVPTEDELDPRHHGAAKCARNVDRLRLAAETVDYSERVGARNDVEHRSHETETQEASVADQQGPLDWNTEPNLYVPKTFLREASSFGEGLDTSSDCIERFSLRTDGIDRSVHVAMAKCLGDRGSCRCDLKGALHARLGFGSSASRLGAAALGFLGHCNWSHRAEDASSGPNAVVAEHDVVNRRNQDDAVRLFRFWVEEICSREPPADVVAEERTSRGDLDEESPDPAVSVAHANGWNRNDTYAALTGGCVRSIGLSAYEMSVDIIGLVRHRGAQSRSRGVACRHYQ